VYQIGHRVDLVLLGCLYDAVDDCTCIRTTWCVSEQPILAALCGVVGYVALLRIAALTVHFRLD
jgi:hypothetical protein